jgi:hypothetical protein
MQSLHFPVAAAALVGRKVLATTVSVVTLIVVLMVALAVQGLAVLLGLVGTHPPGVQTGVTGLIFFLLMEVVAEVVAIERLMVLELM